LVVEDNQDAADIYKSTLENRGHVVTMARDGGRCLQTYFDHMKKNDHGMLFDVIILDQQMPDMSGIDVAKEIQRANPKQRIIFITGHGVEIFEKLKDLKEKVEIMNKPLALKALIAQIEGYSAQKEDGPHMKTGNEVHKRPANLQPSGKEGFVEQIRTQPPTPAKGLDKMTERLQPPETHKMNSNQLLDYVPHEEIINRIRRENRVLHGSTAVKKSKPKINAKNMLKAEFIALPVLAVLFFYAIDNYYQSNQFGIFPDVMASYSVEDLQGQTSTVHHWHIAKETPLTVSIVNLGNLSQEKVNIIKDSILSTDVLHVDNSFLGGIVSGKKSEYFIGWKGALDAINGTKFYVPNQFSIVDSPNSPSQIAIFLSNSKNPDGYSAYTKMVVANSQILKSFITIYDADKFSDTQLAEISRHEFGRALGLGNSNGSQDVMNDTIQANHQYISECDVAAIQSLYDGNIQNKWSCDT
ncbi:MAG: response regulator, partial [Patescibacteria group bacterium]|nr:response regulator [Patescibacteria group bacterium]